MNMKVFYLLSLCCSFFSMAEAGPWPGGSFRLGYGLQPGPDGLGLDGDHVGVAQLSFDMQPGLLPWTLGLDFSTTLDEKDSVSLPSGKAELLSRFQQWTLSVKWFQNLAFCDVYGGVGYSMMNVKQKLTSATGRENESDTSSGPVIIVGLTDLPIYFPIIGWGVEYRYASLDADAITDVENQSSTWLITCGIGW
jgi:hypothetical protein